MGIVYFLMNISEKSLSAFGNVERSPSGMEGAIWSLRGFSVGFPHCHSVTGSLVTYLSFRWLAGFSSGILQITECYGYGKQTLKENFKLCEMMKGQCYTVLQKLNKKTELIASVMRSLSVENSSRHFETWFLLSGWCFLGSSQSPVLQKNGNPEQTDFELREE